MKPTSNALLLAFNKRTGAEVWRMYHESYHLGGGYYACPTSCTIQGKPCLVYHTGNACFGLEPTSGKVLWKHVFSDDDLQTKKGRHGITGQEPAVLGNRIICCIHPDNSAGLGVCLEVSVAEGTDQVKEVWRTNCSIITVATTSSGKIMFSASSTTTPPAASARSIASMSPRARRNGNKRMLAGLLCWLTGNFSASRASNSYLSEASVNGYKELARCDKLFAPEEVSYRYSDRIAPVLSNGRIYCRSQNGILVCLDVRGK